MATVTAATPASHGGVNDMEDGITIKFTKDELSYLLQGAYLSYREYKDSQGRWPYPPPEVAQECSDQAYKLYMKIRKAYDDARKQEEPCPMNEKKIYEVR